MITATYKPRGIQLIMLLKLEEHDFDYDPVITSVTDDHQQERNDKYTNQTWRTISTTKIQLMRLSSTPTAPITRNGNSNLISSTNGAQVISQQY